MTCLSRARPLRRSRGVALAIVLWFIAGMSLLVAGIVLSARSDARLAQIHLQRAQATALGDGAINLLLADMAEERFAAGEASALPRAVYVLGDQSVAVVALPSRWMIDINGADSNLWAQVLAYGGAVGGDGPQMLGNAVVQWRAGLTGGGARRFEALEDLLSVEGMNRTSWESIRDYLAPPRVGGSADLAGQGARGSLDRLRQLTPSQRLQSADLLGPPEAKLGSEGTAGVFRVDALVPLGDRRWLRRRWVTLNSSGSGLPWNVLRSEPARIVTPPPAAR